MANEIQMTDARETFRGIASDRMKVAADMSLHELVDEFLRLTAVMNANHVDADDTDPEWHDGKKLNNIGKVARRERGIVNGAAKARFGIEFDSYDSSF